MSNKIYEIITNQVLDSLDKGSIPWKRPWKGGKFPMNLKSKKEYRGINILLLIMMGYSSRYWLTFKQANAMGGKVRKGEKSTMVIFWKFLEKEDEDGNIKTIPMLRYYRVFNLEQIEGIEDPDDKDGIDHEPLKEAERVIMEMPDRPEIKHEGGRAFYRPSDDIVTVPKKERFESIERYYGVMFHELGHSTGHERRLGRKSVMEGAYFGDNEYSKEELVAEFTSCFVCGELGIFDEHAENSAAYIKNWSEKLKENRKWVISAAGKAQKAADYILKKWVYKNLI